MRKILLALGLVVLTAVPALAQTVEQRVTTLEGAGNSISSRVTTLETSVTALETAVATNTGDIVALAATVATNAVNVQTLFVNVGVNADALNNLPDYSLTIATNVAAIASNAAAIASLPTGSDPAIAANLASITANTNAVAANVAAIVALDARVAAVESAVGAVGSMTTAISENGVRITTLENSQTAWQGTTLDLLDRIAALEAVPAPDLSGIAANTAALSAYIASNDFQIMLLNEVWGSVLQNQQGVSDLWCFLDPDHFGPGGCM